MVSVSGIFYFDGGGGNQIPVALETQVLGGDILNPVQTHQETVLALQILTLELEQGLEVRLKQANPVQTHQEMVLARQVSTLELEQGPGMTLMVEQDWVDVVWRIRVEVAS